MFDTPPTEVLVNAEKFFQHYKSKEMQNYGRWVYAIWLTTAGMLQNHIQSFYYENLTANNNMINQFLAISKEMLLKKDIKDFVGLDLVELKTFLDEIKFFELFKPANIEAATFESIKQDIAKTFYSFLLTASMVGYNYPAYALWADLSLVDAVIAAPSIGKVNNNWNIDQIAKQNIYAAKGPHVVGGDYYKNIKYFIMLMELGITNVVAIGKVKAAMGGSDFLDYTEPHEFNGIDPSGNKFTLSITPQIPLGISLRIENGLDQALLNDLTPYSSFPIEIKRTDSKGDQTTHYLVVHNIQAQDGSAFQLSDESLKKLLQQLNSAPNEENILVHCHAGLGRTGHFVALLLLTRSTKLMSIFSGDNNFEIAEKYKEFIQELRQSRPRLISTAPQAWAALEQAVQFLKLSPQLFSELATSSSTTDSSSSTTSTATTLVPESTMTPPHTPNAGQERGDPTIDMLIQSGGDTSDDEQDSESAHSGNEVSPDSYARLITQFSTTINLASQTVIVAGIQVPVTRRVELGSTPPKNA